MTAYPMQPGCKDPAERTRREQAAGKDSGAQQPCEEGYRDAIYRIALDLAGRYGDTEKAHDLFFDELEDRSLPMCWPEYQNLWYRAVSDTGASRQQEPAVPAEHAAPLMSGTREQPPAAPERPDPAEPDPPERPDPAEPAEPEQIPWPVPAQSCPQAPAMPEQPPVQDEGTPLPDGMPWETPVSLKAEKLPNFPSNVYPRTIRSYAAALSENTQTPPDLAAVNILPILAVCLQGKYRVHAREGWDEPLNLFPLTVMDPSEGKSIVANPLRAPILRYEREWNEAHAKDIEFGALRLRELESREEAVVAQAARGQAGEDELQSIAAEKTGFRPMHRLQLFSDNITMPMLAATMAENGGRAAILSTEGGMFRQISGKKDEPVDYDILLKAYSGEAARTSRISRGTDDNPEPALTIMMMAQPSVLAEMIRDRDFNGKGLNARFLYCLPKSRVGTRRFDSPPVPASAQADYNALIRTLLEVPYPAPGKEAPLLTLSPEARDIADRFYTEVEQGLNGEYEEIRAWAGRMFQTALRIAGLLCCVWTAEDRHGSLPAEGLVIDEDNMADAILVAKYFLAHAAAAFDANSTDLLNRQCSKVMRWLYKNRRTEFTRADIMRHVAGLKTAAQADPVLQRLQEYRYIEVCGQPWKERTGRGRPPAVRYRVNPLAYRKQDKT